MDIKNTKPNFSETMRIIGKALKISFLSRSKASICVSIVGFGVAFVPLFISIILRQFTDLVYDLYISGEAFFSGALRTFLILASLYVLQAVFSSVQGYFSVEDTINGQRFLKEKVLKCICNVKYKYIENYDDFVEKITFSESYAGEQVANSMQSILLWLQNGITFVSVFIVLFQVNSWIVVLLIVTCIPAVVLSYKQKDEEYMQKTKWMKEGAFMADYYLDTCRPVSMNEVRFFGIFPYMKEKWKNMSLAYITAKKGMTKKHVLYNSIADILRNSVFIVILLITVKQIFDNPSIGLGTFMLVLTMAVQMQNVTMKLFTIAAQFAGNIAYMKDFFALDALEYEGEEKEAKVFSSLDIGFRNVSFSYPNTDREVLKNISLDIKQGEKIAIVGANGSGKSTFISLLCGMYDVEKGEVKINEENIRNNKSKLRQNISVVFQDYAKYELSIRDNITLSDTQKTMQDEELLELCSKTGSYDFIKEQPEGLDEMIGSFSEDGNNASGGQWQKIAITRAAYRDKARIMILDEPTAALDPISEANIYKNFTELTGDRTAILISHRLGITQLVDRILVFDEGRIVEDGNHEELIQKNGLYAQMYSAQAKWYR